MSNHRGKCILAVTLAYRPRMGLEYYGNKPVS